MSMSQNKGNAEIFKKVTRGDLMGDFERALLDKLEGKQLDQQITRNNPAIDINGRSTKKSKVLSINYQAYTKVTSHAIYIVKNNSLNENGKSGRHWSIFNSNGEEGNEEILAAPCDGVLIIRDDKVEIDSNNILKEHTEISPESTWNTGNDSVNPGFCQLFGLIFLSYYYHNKDEKDWLKRWVEIKKKMKDESYRFKLASDVLLLIPKFKGKYLDLAEFINKELENEEGKAGRRGAKRSRRRGRSKKTTRGRSRSKSMGVRTRRSRSNKGKKRSQKK